MANTITADEIREQFSQAMSAMYQQEVPQYGTLLELVADVNLAVLENNPTLHEKLANADELARLNVERHGAIRVGTAQELSTLRRMFAVMGMYPVSYYDLSGRRPRTFHSLSSHRRCLAIAQPVSGIHLVITSRTNRKRRAA